MEARCAGPQTEAVDIDQLNGHQDKGATRIPVSGLLPHIDYLIKREVGLFGFDTVGPRKKKVKSPDCIVACCTLTQVQSPVYLTDQALKKKKENGRV